jgi:hypothetical protein
MDYKKKYLKYRTKYEKLSKELQEGGFPPEKFPPKKPKLRTRSYQQGELQRLEEEDSWLSYLGFSSEETPSYQRPKPEETVEPRESYLSSAATAVVNIIDAKPEFKPSKKLQSMKNQLSIFVEKRSKVQKQCNNKIKYFDENLKKLDTKFENERKIELTAWRNLYKEDYGNRFNPEEERKLLKKEKEKLKKKNDSGGFLDGITDTLGSIFGIETEPKFFELSNELETLKIKIDSVRKSINKKKKRCDDIIDDLDEKIKKYKKQYDDLRKEELTDHVNRFDYNKAKIYKPPTRSERIKQNRWAKSERKS